MSQASTALSTPTNGTSQMGSGQEASGQGASGQGASGEGASGERTSGRASGRSPFPVAPWWRRLLAMVYDALVVFALAWGATAILLPFNAGKAIEGNPIYDLYLLLVVFCYFVASWYLGGQTLGMRAWRLRLTPIGPEGLAAGELPKEAPLRDELPRDELPRDKLPRDELPRDELLRVESPTLARCAFRFVATLLCAAPAGLGFLWMLVDRQRWTWHDRLSQTQLRVIPRRRSSYPAQGKQSEAQK